MKAYFNGDQWVVEMNLQVLAGFVLLISSLSALIAVAVI